MKTLVLFTLVLCLALHFHAVELANIKIAKTEYQQLSSESFRKRIIEGQPLVYHKLLSHFFKNELQSWKSQYLNDTQIKAKIGELFRKMKTERYLLTSFVKEKLLEHLNSNNLSKGFKKQIQRDPEAYFLTPQIYDFLIDLSND